MAKRRTERRLLAAIIFVWCLSAISPTSAMPIGYASLNGGTTGGGNGPTVTATTSSQFRSFATQAGPLNINVVGTLDVGAVRVAADKTISGMGSTSGLMGSLQLSDVSNVIIRNLSLSNPSDVGEGDAITLRESTNVWIDHNNISDSPDGLVDIVAESDFVTVSWNKFFYTQDYAANVNTNHRYSMLIGNGDDRPQDADNLRVTIHHNHWGDFISERMPRARFGDIHVFNNYVNSPGNLYAVRSAVGAEVLVESNYFENTRTPYEKFQTDAGVGEIEARDNVFVNTSGPIDDGIDDVFDPPYGYSPHLAAKVKEIVLASAGVGALPGDFNGDGRVDGIDYLKLLRGESLYPLSASDVADWESNFGTVTPLSSLSTTVPEPGTWIMGIVAALSGVGATSLRSKRRTWHQKDRLA